MFIFMFMIVPRSIESVQCSAEGVGRVGRGGRRGKKRGKEGGGGGIIILFVCLGVPMSNGYSLYQ